MVAAEDCVPNAVKYAVIMILRARNGLLFAIKPAKINWINNKMMVSIKIRTTILINIANTLATWPATVISRNIPKIYRGNKGIITLLMTSMMISLNSPKTFFNTSPLEKLMPKPKMNDRIKALITSNTGGISRLKYALNLLVASDIMGLPSPPSKVGKNNKPEK